MRTGSSHVRHPINQNYLLQSTYIIDLVFVTRCLQAVPTTVVNELTFLRILLGHIQNLELLGLVLTGSWQFQLLQLEDFIKHGDLRGLEPLARVTKAILVLVSTPLMLEWVGGGSRQVFPLPCIDLDEILLLGF